MLRNLILSAICILALSASQLNAQVRNVTYDFQKNTFDNDNDLLSETRFTLTGFIDESVQLVELEIYEGLNKKGEKKDYYSTYWLKDKSDDGNQFYLSVKKPLRQSDKYDFDIRFYRSLTKEEIAYTQSSIITSFQNYLVTIAKTDAKELKIHISPEEIQQGMNTIVAEGLVKYRTRGLEGFPGFSDILISQLEDFASISGRVAKSIIKDENNSLTDVYAEKIADIMEQAELEVEQYFNQEVLVLDEVKTVTDHPTERQKNIVALNAGYGGAWFNGNLNNFDYGHAPYVGVSFPLGKKAFSSKFWSNSSISAGVFVMNFKDNDGNKIKGPIIQVPLYVAFGYKFFRFLRFNAGAVLLEKKEDDGQFVNVDKIFVRPFVGLSIELNFWADFAK